MVVWAWVQLIRGQEGHRIVNSKQRLSMIVVGSVLVALCGVFLYVRLGLGIPDGLPEVSIEVTDQEVTLRSRIQIPEERRAINSAIKTSGLPVRPLALLHIGWNYMLLVDARNDEGVGADGREHPMLLLPVKWGITPESYIVTGTTTNVITIHVSDRTSIKRQKTP